uniref:Uncharacterized protein n=1 Tax=Sinocyclocheilus rhinocerous TaxID=307959 RepID=A0A673NB93_9TELE
MAVVKACKILITGANRGLGLEMIKQLSANSCPKQHIFATCRDPDGPKSEALRTLMFVLLLLDSDDPSSLNLLVNNAGIVANGTIQTSSVEDMKNTNTNVIGPLLIIRAAKASGIPEMSMSKVRFNMLTVLAAEEFKADEILCMALHPGWVKTELGGDEATLEPKESVEGMLRVIGSLTKKQHGGFMNYTGETVTW